MYHYSINTDRISQQRMADIRNALKILIDIANQWTLEIINNLNLQVRDSSRY